jgi:hypothetical protein
MINCEKLWVTPYLKTPKTLNSAFVPLAQLTKNQALPEFCFVQQENPKKKYKPQAAFVQAAQSINKIALIKCIIASRENLLT